MGIFFKRVKVFNRAPRTLYVTFDGQVDPIPPGEYDLPEQTIWKAKNQNPIMGSGDPYNPGVLGTRYLIVMEHEEGFGVPLTKEEWEDHIKRPCREDETIWFKDKYGEDPKARQIVRGKRNAVAATSRYEAGGAPHGLADFSGKEA